MVKPLTNAIADGINYPWRETLGLTRGTRLLRFPLSLIVEYKSASPKIDVIVRLIVSPCSNPRFETRARITASAIEQDSRLPRATYIPFKTFETFRLRVIRLCFTRLHLDRYSAAASRCGIRSPVDWRGLSRIRDSPRPRLRPPNLRNSLRCPVGPPPRRTPWNLCSISCRRFWTSPATPRLSIWSRWCSET